MTQHVRPRLMNAKDAAVHLGTDQVLRNCVAAGWIKPKQRAKKLTLYSLRELDACADRIEAGEYPQP